MNSLQAISDKTAVSLSLVCAIHCLAMPMAVVLLPSVAALSLSDEAFHIWLLVAVLPFSIYALTMGCKKHKRYRLLLIGGAGLLVLSFAGFFGHDTLGHAWERWLTLIGASVIALGHLWNHRLCLRHDECGCPEGSVGQT